jgi:hypothetical protein
MPLNTILRTDVEETMSLKSKIVVDIDVADRMIRAYKLTKEQAAAPMPYTNPEKTLILNSVGSDRLNGRELGYLQGKALAQDERIVNKHGSISTSGFYGSILIDEKDFIPYAR